MIFDCFWQILAKLAIKNCIQHNNEGLVARIDSVFEFYMKNCFKRTYFEVSTTNEKFHYISRDLHLVNLDHCVAGSRVVH